MIIVETPIFTRQITRLLSAGSYRELQIALVDDPGRAPVIPRSGGLRKVRWKAVVAESVAGSASSMRGFPSGIGW